MARFGRSVRDVCENLAVTGRCRRPIHHPTGEFRSVSMFREEGRCTIHILRWLWRSWSARSSWRATKFRGALQP